MSLVGVSGGAGEGFPEGVVTEQELTRYKDGVVTKGLRPERA